VFFHHNLVTCNLKRTSDSNNNMRSVEIASCSVVIAINTKQKKLHVLYEPPFVSAFVPYTCRSSQSISKSILCSFVDFKDGAYYCSCSYVLRISRYSDFLSPMLTNTGIFLRGLKLSGESRS